MKRVFLLLLVVMGVALATWISIDHPKHYVGRPSQDWVAKGAVADPPVEISTSARGATVIATVTGPPSLLDRIAAVEKLRRDCKVRAIFIPEWFDIDWGDDDRTFDQFGTNQASPILGPDGCEDWRRHAYSAHGSYRIRALLGHLGPTDGAIVDWGSEATIDAQSIPASGFHFEIAGSLTDRTFLFGQSIPVEWNLVTDRPVQLTIAILDESGNKILTETRAGLGYRGVGRTNLHLQGAPYNALVKHDPARVRIEVTAKTADAAIVRQIGWFSLSGEQQRSPSPDEFGPLVSVADDHRTAVFKHVVWHPTCTGYLIDWGDKSPVERRVTSKPDSPGCVLDKTWRETRHTYARPGTYRIIYRVTTFSYQEPPEDSPSYEVLTVEIP